MHIVHHQSCWPGIVPYWPDAELDRLRRLERQAAIEAEKARIRQRLREQGIDPDAPYGWPCIPVLPCLPVIPICRPLPCRPLTVDDVLRRVGR